MFGRPTRVGNTFGRPTCVGNKFGHDQIRSDFTTWSHVKYMLNLGTPDMCPDANLIGRPNAPVGVIIVFDCRPIFPPLPSTKLAHIYNAA